MNVEHGGGVDLGLVLLGQHLRHAHLVLLLHLLHGAHEVGVVHQRLQLGQLVQVRDPVLADFLMHRRSRAYGSESGDHSRATGRDILD